VEHDQGRFHASAHLESIMWPDEKVTVRQRGWPTGLPPDQRAAIVARIRRNP
jgi:hypothetical protein